MNVSGNEDSVMEHFSFEVIDDSIKKWVQGITQPTGSLTGQTHQADELVVTNIRYVAFPVLKNTDVTKPTPKERLQELEATWSCGRQTFRQSADGNEKDIPDCDR